MRKISRFLIVSLMGVAAWGQQAATVTSTAPFSLRGANVTPGQGIPAWPVLPGDTIRAGIAPTVVTFPDGSVITLDPGAEAKISFSGPTPVFQLLSCSAHYSLTSQTAVKLMERDRQATEKTLTGVIATPCGRAATAAGSTGAGWWTVGHTLLVVGAGAGVVGLGYGIGEATRGGPAVSPSH
jgi:hypothetical protein